jgi:TRAP-type C4-dicarboxylate transport system permease small subunit
MEVEPMKFLKILDDRFEEYLLVASLVFSTILIFVQVVARYVFSSSISWSEELARYLFLWQTWLGTALAVKYNKHIRVDILMNYLSEKNKKILNDFVRVIWIGFICILAYKSFQLTAMQFSRNQLSPALQIPMWIPYASVPVGCTLMIIRLIQRLVLEKLGKHKEA